MLSLLKTYTKIIFVCFVFCYAFSSRYVSAAPLEEMSLVTTGLGVAAPSYRDGLSGENPAGLAFNNTSKLHGELSTAENNFNEVRGSGGILIGNGSLGAGLEFQRANETRLNWGMAASIAPLGTTIAVSGHHAVPGTVGTYDLGMLIGITKNIRLGLQGSNFIGGVDTVGFGLVHSIDPMWSYVLDFMKDLNSGGILFSPGLALNLSHSVMFTLSYVRSIVDGSIDVLGQNKRTGFKSGLGIRLFQPILFRYEYNDQEQHTFGLSLRM